MKQIVDIPVGGGLQDFLPDLGTAAPSAVSRDELGQGLVALFAAREKCGGRREFECESARALELIHASAPRGAQGFRRVSAVQ